MAQDADNDNATRSAIDAIRAAAPNWTDYGPGGTALAPSATADRAPDAPTPDAPAPDAPAPDAAEQDRPRPGDTAVEPLAGGDDGQRTTAAPAFAVTDAASLTDLGIEVPQRPLPRRAATQPVHTPQRPVQSSSIASAPAREHQQDRAQRPSSPTGPLFNRPPEMPSAEQADAFANAAFATAATGSRALTSQPGFLLGLVTAAVAGAALYIYLA